PIGVSDPDLVDSRRAVLEIGEPPIGGVGPAVLNHAGYTPEDKALAALGIEDKKRQYADAEKIKRKGVRIWVPVTRKLYAIPFEGLLAIASSHPLYLNSNSPLPHYSNFLDNLTYLIDLEALAVLAKSFAKVYKMVVDPSLSSGQGLHNVSSKHPSSSISISSPLVISTSQISAIE
ncbi:hypothetical protein V8G54_017083, partial [Vigna mungo]